MRSKRDNGNRRATHHNAAILSLQSLTEILVRIDDAEIIKQEAFGSRKIGLVYIRTLVDLERLNESIIKPLKTRPTTPVVQCVESANVSQVNTLEQAERNLMSGCVLVNDMIENVWWAIKLPTSLGRSVQPSETESVVYGAKESFTEQLDQNITLIRRRLPVVALKTEKFSIGTLSNTSIVLMYLEGITNPNFIKIARSKIKRIDFDQFLADSQVAAFMDDNIHSVFPQFLSTDRPDQCSWSLGLGKVVILVDGSPFALVAPITFFHLFQSPEDYFLRWIVASLFRSTRYASFLLSSLLVPLYVALTTYNYQVVPIQILGVLLESRSRLPFSPFWEALLMLVTLQILNEASLRMPTKAGQTLGVVGGIVIGEAAVTAGFVSNVLIVLVGISAIASFLVPNYQLAKSNTVLQFILLILAALFGIFGIAVGILVILAHLNALTSLRQPYLAPVAPLFIREWSDFFIRAPLPWQSTRPKSLAPLQRWRMGGRKS
ncbi:spore germination protein [Alicyclobacillus tolerans]|uniref:spore germination protein n=1 Tax=Alicyclobacillus tolerans TaxID=90970 RepID=UPI001F45582A|nr:spore germination protein [Alicyclobacillus tolerans]MCF8568363.1 spore germination protein [Alicyclobacillus tolerans]